jgi:putative hydrolase of HD superfamily
MITSQLLRKIFDAANMQRWNDHIRPVELVELDKQAHKMVIAWVLARYEEANGGEPVDWIELIEGGLFEFLQRLVVTDLKPQLLHRIQEDHSKRAALEEWAYAQIRPLILSLGEDFCERFRGYFATSGSSIARQILQAAHFYATKWEFDILESANPRWFEIRDIRLDLQHKQERSYRLEGMRRLVLYSNIRSFVDLCGHLRFQVRWSHLHRVPRTSVLGHMLIVAILSYLASLEIGACKRRCVNNYFTGLFHDLPEVLTRDIVNPVKHSVEGLDQLIKEYEKNEMERRVYKLLPTPWLPDMKMFTQREFITRVSVDGRMLVTTTSDINASFNSDEFNPRDGELVKSMDNLCAFIEAHLAIENGLTSSEFAQARQSILRENSDTVIGGVDVGRIYREFS